MQHLNFQPRIQSDCLNDPTTLSKRRTVDWLAVIPNFILFSVCAFAQPAQHVVISEVQIAGTSTKDEFVELYNPTSTSVSLIGWRLSRKTSSGSESNLLTSFPAITIPARGFLLAAPAEYDTIAHGMILPDVPYSTTQRLSADNTVILYSDAGMTVVDKVGMGAASDIEGTAAPNPVTGGSIERKARSTSTSATLGGGGLDEFAGNGFDTNNNADDFVAHDTSNPQTLVSQIEGLLVHNTTTDAFFGSLQLGIDRAGTGHTLEVGKGSLHEQVTIDKSLTLKGVQAGVDARTRAGEESVLQTITIDSAVTDVGIDGFQLDVGTRSMLIDSRAVGSIMITNNKIKGDYASGDTLSPIILIHGGSTAVFSGNTVTDVFAPDSTQGTIRFGGLTTTLTIEENDFEGAVLTITDLQGADVAVRNNHITDSSGDGLLVSNAFVSDVRITDNSFMNNSHSGLQLNFSNLTVAGNVEVDRNVFSRNQIGLGLVRAAGVTVSRNTIEDNGTGIQLDGAAVGISVHSNTIAHNTTWNLNNVSTDVVDARYNWWGSLVETDIISTINGDVDHDPWMGKPEQQAVAASNSIMDFRSAALTMRFAFLPPNIDGGSITVARLPTKPEGVPAPPMDPGTLLPLYLDIDASGLPNYAFHVDVTLDVSTVSNFSSTTSVLFYSFETGQWVALAGTYRELQGMFAFGADLFTTFAFVNFSNPLDVFLTSDPAEANAHHTVVYPKVGMSAGATFAPDDWAYTAPTLPLYVVPHPGEEPMKAAEFFVSWDPSRASLTFESGNLFGADGTEGFYRDTLVSTGLVKINTASLVSENVTPSIGTYLAKLNLSISEPGYNAIVLSGTDFRFYDPVSESQQHFSVVTDPGAVKFYLGDFAASADTVTTGDGRVDFDDLAPFSLAYFSRRSQPSSAYKAKFDIGPTNAVGSYFAMPSPDGRVDFEDLVIFSIGYGKSITGQLGKKSRGPLIVAAQTPERTEEAVVRVPLLLSGNVHDVRALSITITYPSSSLRFETVEKVGEFDQEYYFLVAEADETTVTVDAAVIGLGHPGLSSEGIFAHVTFKELRKLDNHAFEIQSLRARDSNNTEIEVAFEKTVANNKVDLPTTFALSQNYPNPSNPTTTIEYQLPHPVQVQISLYSIVGEKVAVLVNEYQDAGNYRIAWDGTGMLGRSVSSGVYFYRMQARQGASPNAVGGPARLNRSGGRGSAGSGGKAYEFSDVKKLILLR